MNVMADEAASSFRALNNAGTRTNLAKRSKKRKRISIGLATRQRPKMLEQCLRTLTAQVVPEGAELVIVVVENDSEPLCEGIVATVAKQSVIPIAYHIERHIGLSAARNAVLDAAMANGSDYLAFIDDDELAYPEWISRLFAAMTEHGAMMAGGPVMRKLQCKSVPEWAAQYYGPLLAQHDSWPNVISGVFPLGTGNMLFDLAPVREMGIRFDMNFNLSGAEDNLFIDALAKACDGKSVYVNDAIACEIIPASRLKLSYVFKRVISSCSNNVRIQKFRKDKKIGYRFILQLIFLSMSLIIMGGILSTLTYFVDKNVSAKSILQVAKGIGILLGLAGYHNRLYAKVTGI